MDALWRIVIAAKYEEERNGWLSWEPSGNCCQIRRGEKRLVFSGAIGPFLLCWFFYFLFFLSIKKKI